jgi:hypothetical protein
VRVWKGEASRYFPCAAQAEKGSVEIQENTLERFILAGFLYHGIWELKDILILHLNSTQKFVVIIVFMKTGFDHVVQTGLELVILLPQSPEC